MMGGMLATLKGGALYVAGAVVLALIGAVTFLAQNGNITGSVLTGVTGITTAHVTGQQVAGALNTPPPAPPASPPSI